MTEVYEKLLQCYVRVKEYVGFKPEVAVVLGSGLGGFADRVQVEATLDYKDIKGFPISSVSGHKGRYVFGYVDQVPVMLMQGRIHFYEGYSMSDVVLPVRLMGLMGAKRLLLTNAAGAINTTFQVGDLMLITDQISSFVPSPLIGENIDELGVRFPDMGEIYSLPLRKTIKGTAEKIDVKLQDGVYVQVTGPNYESPHEIRMYRTLGADAVGMSTAVEAIAAKHMGMEVCGISCITNLASDVSGRPLSHDEVKDAANQSGDRFMSLLNEVLKDM